MGIRAEHIGAVHPEALTGEPPGKDSPWGKPLYDWSNNLIGCAVTSWSPTGQARIHKVDGLIYFVSRIEPEGMRRVVYVRQSHRGMYYPSMVLLGKSAGKDEPRCRIEQDGDGTLFARLYLTLGENIPVLPELEMRHVERQKTVKVEYRAITET